MSLEVYRNKIDEIDEQLIYLIAKRFENTRQIGIYKKAHKLPPKDSLRENEQKKRFIELANNLSISPDLVTQIMSLIIDEVVKQHKKM